MNLIDKEDVIKIGTVVKLKGGDSPIMNVNAELKDDLVECVWFNGNISKKEIFNKNILFDYGLAMKKKLDNEKVLEKLSIDELEQMIRM